MSRNIPGRLHLLPARAAPIVVIIRRKPTDWTHVIRWNTATDEFEHGSWLHGKIYHLRSDVSFDGQWLVYFAMGMKARVWDDVCPVLSLKRPANAWASGTYFGGGYFAAADLAMLHGWGQSVDELPFRTESYVSDEMGDLGVLHRRLQRDGWRRKGSFGKDRELVGAQGYQIRSDDDPGWYWQPTPQHPVLRMFYRGFLERGYTYEFALDGHPQLLDSTIDWATWDSLGQLIVARRGGVERYTLADLDSGSPGFQHSFEDLDSPPPEFMFDS